MREIAYLINDVREQTDNRDTNGVKDKEIIRYYQDAKRAIQALIFKNNPLCSYFQESVEFTPVAGTREYDLPSNCYAQNAVTRVEVQNSEDTWVALERAWPEDNMYGWFTRNGKLVLTGDEEEAYPETIRVWYFKRLPRFDKAWARVSSIAGQTVNLTSVDTDFSTVDNYVTFYNVDGEPTLEAAKVDSSTDSTVVLAASANTGSLNATDWMLMGQDSAPTLDLPDEVEPYLQDYVARRIMTRNNYISEAAKLDAFTEEEKSQIIAIFGDAGQTITRTPITDTEFLRL
jgi:hypothetical protein